MASLGPRRIPKVVFGLTLFWSGVLSAFFWTGGFHLSFIFPWLVALVVGVRAAQVKSDEYKKSRLSRLLYRFDASLPVKDFSAFKNSARGISSSLGPVPFQQAPLARQDSYSFADLQAHAPVELARGDVLAVLLGRFLGEGARGRWPAHVAIFDALAMTMLEPSNLKTPAGIDRHGGRSLLTHSLLVTALMSHRAKTFAYLPHGFDAIDPSFVLDPLDPLIPILGMAHDLGKVRCMVVDKEGTPVSLLAGHEALAAREVSRLPEFWDARIDTEERRLLQTALAFSGRMADTPIQRIASEGKHVVTSDRLHALMGLLAECDRLASSIEMGGSYKFDVEPIPSAEPQHEAKEAVEPVNLLTSLSTYFVTKMPVNARSGTRSVGFKRCGDEFSKDRHLVIIDETEFSKQFAAFLGHPSLADREGKSCAITKQVLELLDQQGYLHRLGDDPADKSRPATSCLYKIEFRDSSKKPDEAPGLVLSSAFVVDVTDWPSMAKLQGIPSCLSTPSFAGFRLGRQPGSASRRSALDDIAAEALGEKPSGVGIDVMQLAKAKSAAKAANLPKKIEERIRLSLGKERLPIAASDESHIAVVGCEEELRRIGLEIKLFDELPVLHKAVGVIAITESKKTPGSFVVRFDRKLYASVV